MGKRSTASIGGKRKLSGGGSGERSKLPEELRSPQGSPLMLTIPVRRFSLHNTYFVKGVPGFMEGFILVSHEKSFYVDCGSAVAANSWINEIGRMFDQQEGKIVTRESSWRGNGSPPRVAMWGLGEEGEGGENETETWELNKAAMSQGKGVLGIISKEEVDKIGEAAIALISKEGTDSPAKGRNSLGSIARRMSQRLNISSGGGSSNPRLSSGRLSEPSVMVAEGGVSSVERDRVASEGGPMAVERISVGGGGGNVGIASRGPSPIVSPPPRSGFAHHVAPPSLQNSGFNPNQFVIDSLVKHTGEFRVNVNSFGLGIDLLDSQSPYPDHPSPSIVKVASFPNLPNGCKSAAESAGVRKGDYIVSINGVGVATTFHVEQALRNQKVGIGSIAIVRVRRGGGVGGGTGGVKEGDGTADLLGLGSSGGGTPAPRVAQPRAVHQHRAPPPAPAPTRAALPSSSRRSSDGGGADGGRFAEKVGGIGAAYERARGNSAPVHRQDDWMKSHPQEAEESDETKRLSRDFGTKEGFDPVKDIKSDIDFLGLLGRTRAQYLKMAEADRAKLRRDVGI